VGLRFPLTLGRLAFGRNAVGQKFTHCTHVGAPFKE
jgi:hypothetical protein